MRIRRGLFNARETTGVLQGADAFRSHSQEHSQEHSHEHDHDHDDHDHDHDHSHNSVNGSISSVGGFGFNSGFAVGAPPSSVAASGNTFDGLSDNHLPLSCKHRFLLSSSLPETDPSSKPLRV